MDAGLDTGTEAQIEEVLIYEDGRLIYSAGQHTKRDEGSNSAGGLIPPIPLGAIVGESCSDLGNGGGGPPLEPLQRRFEVIAQTNPAAWAVNCSGARVTYGELDAQADQLALFLQQGGLRPGAFCLLSLEPSMALVRAILAVLKAGAACLQFDPRLSAGQAAAALAAIRPAILFTRRGALPWAASDGIRTIACDEEAADLPYGWPDEIPVRAAMPVQALATASGSGLCLFMRTHGAVACRIEAMYGAGPPGAPAFDLAGFLRPLSVGAQLNVAAVLGGTERHPVKRVTPSGNKTWSSS